MASATNSNPQQEGKHMKSRDIEKDEINKITDKCHQPREKAFFTVMRQSGLPPHIIKQLKIRNVEKISDPDTPTPCKIRFRSLPDFVGAEAVKYLQQYLATRTNLTPESLLFSAYNNPNKEINTKDVSRAFKLAARELEKAKKITYDVRREEPSELRLYSLIKFYRKSAKYYLTELNNSSTPKQDEFYRKLYEEKAMPFLEIEPPTPIEIQQLKKENKQLKERLTKIEKSMMPVTRLYHELLGIFPETVFPELKPYIPTKTEEDREQRRQQALRKIVESIREKERKQTNNQS
jgi:hypothetical protein